MRKVAAIGIGQTVVSEHWEKSLKELAGDAILDALMDAQINIFDSLFIGNMMSASANQQQNIGAYIADWVGARGSESIRVESACSSGSAAFRAAILAVASNEVDVAVAAAVEKMTDSPSAEITANLATAADADWEVSQGVSFVSLNALLMQRYLYEYGWVPCLYLSTHGSQCFLSKRLEQPRAQEDPFHPLGDEDPAICG